MLKIVGNDVHRGTEKIGYLEGNDVYNHVGRKVGYFSGNDIFDMAGKKVGYILNNRIHTASGESISVSENRSHVSGGTYSDLHRAAIRLLLGD
jgi:sporulation protein YlmC with PRC-barrel domain